MREHGIAYAAGKVEAKLSGLRMKESLSRGAKLGKKEREEQERHAFSARPKISVLAPLYNTQETYLKDMIGSVLGQTYGNWELCLCDASDAEHAWVGKYCREQAKKEPRIVYRKLEKNGGISENTNACAHLATGEYLAPLDHDDMLHASALYEAARAIEEEGADFVYTDEAKFEEDPEKAHSPNYKPDFAKDELRAHNYICHLTVYSRELMEKAGGYRKECDGSQDHDIVLRMTERAKKVVHIPKVLYYWRVHSGSVSAGVEVKAYAVEAAHKAVRAQLARSGEEGEVASTPPFPSLYRVKYELKEQARVSVVIYGVKDGEQLARCARAMEDATAYYPMDVTVVEGEMEREAFRQAMKRLPTVKPLSVVWREEQEGTEALTLAAERSAGKYVAFLHADAAPGQRDWAEEMLMFAQREDVGAVGGKLAGADGLICGGGLALDRDEAGLLHAMHSGEPAGGYGYEAALWHVRDVTALDGAMLMVSKEKLLGAGGLKAEMGDYRFADLCLRLREAGLLNVWTPFAKAWLLRNPAGPEKGREAFARAWGERLAAGDPYRNPNVKAFRLY